MSKQAQIEKEKGNNAFKAADYAAAVGHYSAAIIHDREDFTLPLNRAAAYLKLEKYDDADRDCTTVLTLKPGNAKALFRRGQARLATKRLHEAEEDLKYAAKLEPSNAAVAQELAKVSEALKSVRASKGKQPMDVSMFKRRRVPIKIVEDDSEPQAPIEDKASKPKSILKKSAAPPAQDVQVLPPSDDAIDHSYSGYPKEPPATPSHIEVVGSTSELEPLEPKTEAKPDREAVKPARVGGGIFRADGTKTVFPPRDVVPSTSRDTAPRTSYTMRSPSVVTPKVPANLFDLSRVWDMCSTQEERYHLLTTIPPSQFPAFFQTSLEPSLLTSILQMFLDRTETDKSDAVKSKVTEYLNAFATVQRFSTLLLFLSPVEKETARKLLSRLDTSKLNPIWGKLL